MEIWRKYGRPIKHDSEENCFRSECVDEIYFRIYSGTMKSYSYNYPCKSRNLYVQRLKWEYTTTNLVPINNFEKKQFFHIDRYRLVDDLDYKPFKHNPVLNYEDLFDQSKAEKLVKYRFTKDRHKNFDNEKDCIINLD